MPRVDRTFLFVVRHARWLARVPLMTHFFDALLLVWTCALHRPRIAAMELLEARALTLPGVRLRLHALGGYEFVRDKHELGHVHGLGLVDARLPRADAERLVTLGDVRAHHVYPPASGWVSFQLETVADVPRALELLALAAKRQ